MDIINNNYNNNNILINIKYSQLLAKTEFIKNIYHMRCHIITIINRLNLN